MLLFRLPVFLFEPLNNSFRCCRGLWIETCAILFFFEPICRRVKLYPSYEFFSILISFKYLYSCGVLVKLFVSRGVWEFFDCREVRNFDLFICHFQSFFEVCCLELVYEVCFLCQRLEEWLCACCRRILYDVLFHVFYCLSRAWGLVELFVFVAKVRRNAHLSKIIELKFII